jgi:Domain of unknown function (DUF4282)
MAGHASGHGRPDDQEQYGYRQGDYQGAGTPPPPFDQQVNAAVRPGATRHSAVPGTETKGFVRSLFDVGFTSFVTPKVIKVLYVLIMIGTILSALFYAVVAFRLNVALGIATLLVLGPLFVLITLAMWRIFLEFFMVIFRISDDIHDIRQRGEFR